MSETPKDKDQEKGDEVLRRLLKTPPQPHIDSKGTRTKPPRKVETASLRKSKER